jgi:serine phosphatase RsbU (regulator of sigma subunit)
MDTRPRAFSPQDTAALIDLGHWAERALAQGLHHDRLLEVAGALAPSAVAPDGYRIAGTTVPYGDLSGDLHDWSVVDGDLVLTLADVMGTEQPAALLAAGIRAALRQHRTVAPVAAVAAVEPALAEDLGRASAFATLFHARLDPASGVVDVVDAGHGLAVHVPAAGTPRVLRSHGLPLGLHAEGARRRASTTVLEPGDVLVVVSDGALDLGDGTIDTLLDLARTLRAASRVAAFRDTVRLRAAARAEDDVTAVALGRA